MSSAFQNKRWCLRHMLCTVRRYSLARSLTVWLNGSSISCLDMICYSPPLYLQHFAVFLNAWHFVMAKWRTLTPPANQEPLNKSRAGTKRPWEQRRGRCRFLVSSGDAHAGTLWRLRLQPGRSASVALPSADRWLFSTRVYCQLCLFRQADIGHPTPPPRPPPPIIGCPVVGEKSLFIAKPQSVWLWRHF